MRSTICLVTVIKSKAAKTIPKIARGRHLDTRITLISISLKPELSKGDKHKQERATVEVEEK